MASTYLMENEEEIQRLERKTDAGVVERYASMAGLKPGMRVIDLCCGAGVTTSILARLTGPQGSVTGVDFSAERLEYARAHHGSPRTTFELRDVRAKLEGVGPFDFAWVRFALEYFRAESFDIVSHLAEVMAPGGIVCLIDLDHNCLNHYGLSDRLERGLTSAVRQLESVGNFDPYAGRKLYSYLHRLHFTDIAVDAQAHHLIYGPLKEVDEYNWTRKIEVIVKRGGIELPDYGSPQEFLDDFLAFFRDPGRFTYTPVIAAWGKRP
jgi:ubiquinone/menaquinone biosynthesis C-methylase UbiE